MIGIHVVMAFTKAIEEHRGNRRWEYMARESATKLVALLPSVEDIIDLPDHREQAAVLRHLRAAKAAMPVQSAAVRGVDDLIATAVLALANALVDGIDQCESEEAIVLASDSDGDVAASAGEAAE